MMKEWLKDLFRVNEVSLIFVPREGNEHRYRRGGAFVRNNTEYRVSRVVKMKRYIDVYGRRISGKK